ncbi:hypothetical protein OC835_000765 [Tilletia horrida]|nr:hypothetical protein OC835_000765 [Tilletia horrida]
MFRIKSVNAVLSTLVQAPAGPAAASAPAPSASNGHAQIAAEATQEEATRSAASIAASLSQTSLADGSGVEGSAAPPSPAAAAAAPATAAAGGPEEAAAAAASSSASSPRKPGQHPHTALIVLAYSGRVFASASTLAATSSTSSRSEPSRTRLSYPAATLTQNLFVFHPHSPDSHSQSQEKEAGADAGVQLTTTAVLKSLQGEERMRALGGLATMAWRENLISESPVIPQVILTTLGLVLIQPLGASSGGPTPAVSVPNSPPQPEDSNPASLADLSSEGMLQLAQRRRAASLRSARLLLVLNSTVDFWPTQAVASPLPAERDAAQEGDAKEDATAGDEATAAGMEGGDQPTSWTWDEADTDTLISIAAAGAQFLGPTLASVAYA